MAGFNGTLLKSTKTSKIFPHKYINIKSFKAVPNSREEIEAYRDDNTRNLTRVTASGKKTSISFSTLPGLHLSEVAEILNFFTEAEERESNPAKAHLERKSLLIYWNDEEMTYKTGYFYRTDIDFTKEYVTENDIIYDSFDINLVEY